jgi:glycosyltransferase involved in cell wall biosynthesis
MKLSVALCTYNGAPYLQEQLESISNQEWRPNEVIVCDDCSTDDTCQILAEWAGVAPFQVKVLVNQKNLGAIKNFEHAISLCTGDVIALADQDDIWHPMKLARVAEFLSEHLSADMVFTDAYVVDEQLRPMGYRMWETRRFRSSEQRLVRNGRAVDVFLRRNVATGATMAFRSRLKQLILPIPQNPVHLHDGWIAFLAAAVSNVGFICDPLVRYRQRTGQIIGAHPPTGIKMLARAVSANSWSQNIESHRATLEWFKELECRLQEMRGDYPCEERVFDLVRAKRDHLRRRMSMPRSRPLRTRFILNELATLGYHRYSIGIWAAAKDLTA